LVVDDAKLLWVQLSRDGIGEVQLYVQYALLASGQHVRAVHRNMTASVRDGRRAAATALLDGLAQDVAASEGL